MGISVINRSGGGAFQAATAFRSYRRYVWQDHFAAGVAGGTDLRGVGELRWTCNNAALLTAVTGVASHPGIYNMASGITSTNYILQGTAWVATGDLSYFGAIVRPQTTASTAFICGVTDAFSADETGNGFYFSFLKGTSNFWRTNTGTGGSVTTNTTAITVTANNWYLLEILKSGSNWVFYINTVLQFTHSTNIDTATVMRPGVFEIKDTASTSQTVDIDYFELRTIDPMGQVWT